MGEGWSDFYGLALTAEATDNPHGNWARAGYSRYLSSSWYSENYYYGARRYSYSTDMLKNPHTFRDIDPTQVDWHTSVPRNPTYASTQDATQVHYQGTVWCVTLWDLRANLILKHGFATGNDRAMFLVAEGMKLGPANPSFIQARDGIIQATLVNHPGDLGEVWTAFAKRGMGDGATAPASSTTTGLTESYNVPDSLELSSRSGWNIRGNKGGPFAPASQALTLSNDGASSLNWSVSTNAPWLSANPTTGTLAPGANVAVTVTTEAATVEAGFHSTSVVFTNTTSGFTQPIGVRLYVTPPVAQAFDLNTNPGWTTSGEWAYGTPTGNGGTLSGGSGNADPAAGATGSSVFGVNLAGNHSTTLTGPHYLTTSPIDLSARKNTRLRFQRWLNTNALANTRVTVEVSTDGTSWREVFVNPGTAITDNAWVLMDYDISSIADQQAAVQVRWSYRTISAPGSYSGWNIDDVQFLGESTAEFTLDIANSVSEGAAPFTGTLNLNLPQAEPVTVTLTSSDPTAATVPASVTLDPGQITKPFAITPVNDSVLDGVQVTTISAAAPNIGSGLKALSVTDDETATLSLAAPAAVTEGMLAITGSLTISSAPAREVQVMLSSSNPALTVPESIVIPSGSTGPVSFSFDAPDNAFAEGAKNVTITAAVTGWTSGVVSVSVADDDAPAIVLTGPAAVREGDVIQSFTATVNTLQTADLILNVGSSDTSELTVPATVTIPAGALSGSFDAVIVDDALADGIQLATITASASGYPNATRDVSVADNEVDHYTFAAIASPQKRSKPIAVAVTARDINGAAITNHSGALTLTSNSAGGPVPFTPTALSGFSNGVAAASITATTTATAMTLTATDTNGKAGISNPFDVEPVQHDTFAWSGLPTGSVFLDTLFSGTATATDDLGNTVATYNDPTVVEAYMPVFERTVGSTGSATSTSKIYNTAAHDSRAQLIYSAAELGATARWIGALNFSLSTSGGQPMQSFTIRFKHTNLQSFDGGGWEEGGWVTVFTSTSFSASSTFCTLITPFYFNGTQNLMVDVSFNNSSASSAGNLRYVASTANRVLSGTSNSTHGDPLTWTAAAGPASVISNELPTLSFYAARSYGPVPASPVSFANGVSPVQAFAPTATNQVVWLLATAPSGVFGFSNKVSISIPSTTVGTDTVFSDGFETGVLGATWSTAGNSGATARTLVTTANTPKAGSYHLTMDTTSTATGTFARNSPTLTLNLAGRKNVSLEWFAKEFLDDNHAPTLMGPLGTFGSTANYDGVAISQDGVTWVEVSPMTSLSSVYGSSSTRVFLDPVIQRLGWSYNTTFRLRFSQYDDQAIPNDGIAIDDVSVKANPVTAIALSLPPTLAEGSLNVPVTVTLPSAAASNTTVTLNSNATARLTIASPVTILAGQTTASTTISAPQNQFADIGKGVIVTASASGQTTSYHHIRVVDDEQPMLTVSMPPSVTEGGASAVGSVSIAPLVPASVPVFLASGSIAEATVSSMVTISTGNPSASFTVFPVDDGRLDGTQTVAITATGNGLISGLSTIDVLDNENPQLVLTPPAPIREGGTFGVGTVSISGQRTMPTTVTLMSSDPGEATVPASVVIPAGQTSVNFQVLPVDDPSQDGTQTVTITASALAFTDATTSVQVRDNDPAFLEISAIASPQVRNAAIPVTITATDENGITLTTFNGTAALSADAGGVSVPVSPAGPITFVNGIWTGSIALGSAASAVTLTATSADGAVGTSNAFDVTPGGTATGLVFTPIPSPQRADTLIPVQVYAADGNGVLVNEVNGPVTIDLMVAPSGPVMASANLTMVNGSASTSFSVPGAIPSVFLRATAGTLNGQTSPFAITAPPSFGYPAAEVLFTEDFESGAFGPEWAITGTNNHRTVVTTAQSPRGSNHMVMDCSSSGTLSRNEATLTLNLAGKNDVALSFWMKEFSDEDHGPPASPFTTGADFDGVAISADGVTWHEVQGLRTANGISGSYHQFTLNLSALAADRGLTLSSAFKIRFNHYDDFPFASDGFAFDDIQLTANAFAPPEDAQTVFAEDFESAVFRPEWEITGTSNHRTVITAAEQPRGSYHLLMDTFANANSRNEATLTLDLTGIEDVSLRFWIKENSDEDQAPPSNPFTGGADFDGVAISADGTTWHEVQPLRGTASTNTYQELAVDLDAALATYGLSYNSSFKIRFNHYDNSPWVSGDGFAFDDIAITARPLNGLTLVLPASLAEGAMVSAHAELATARTVDTVITLNTNRPASLTLPATITIPAGATTSAPFDVTAADNASLTGTLEAEVLATAPGVRQFAADLAIVDNDPPSNFTLSIPTNLAEGGSINGSIAISQVPFFDLPVALTANPAFGLTFPSFVTIPAGATSIGFTLAKPENDAVLEPGSTVLTAALGSTSSSETITLTDNDTAGPLVITLPDSALESASPLAGTVGFAAPSVTGTAIVVSLASSMPGSLTVPATVTIAAGDGVASFSAAPVDNAVQDGARSVTVTASATGLNGGTHDVTIYDEELHHLGFETIASPQIATRPFEVTVRALTIDNRPASIGGTAALAAASGATSVPLVPSTTGVFENGFWTGLVSIADPVTNVILTATGPAGITGSSNAFNVEVGPRLAISPASVTIDIPAGEAAANRTLSLTNPGTSTANWTAAVVYPGGMAGTPPLATVLTDLNDKVAGITSLVPNRYDFNDGVTGTSISDGGNDMYDGGNYLATNITSAGNYLAYSDNAILGSANLGTGGNYFTRKHPGLFVFAADVSGLNYFEITGDLGADGLGSTDTAVLTRTHNGMSFKGFVKRVFGTSKPSVNHLIIMADNGTATHAASTDTNNDYHRLSGLAGVTRIYYLLYAASAGGYIDNAQTQAIMDAFLDALAGAQWLTATPAGGSILAGTSAPLALTLNPSNLPGGMHSATLRLTSNDPTAPQQDIPVTLNVTPAVDHFEWAAVPSPQIANLSFPTTLVARDSTGTIVSGFSGDANLIALAPPVATTSGSGTGTFSYPLYAVYYETRTQAIYSPPEVGPGGRLQSLALDVATVPGALENFTVRVKHTAKSDYTGTGGAVWESGGWTTVYRGTLTIPATGWHTLPLTGSFVYDGTSRLMVDMSFDTAYGAASGSVRATTAAAVRSLIAGSFGSFGDPLTWQGTSPAGSTTTSLPNIRFTMSPLVPVMPSVATFASGQWNGDLTVQRAGTNLTLRAEHASRPALIGQSNLVTVTSAGTLGITTGAGGTEGGSLAATLFVSAAPASNLAVSLSSSDTTEATVPATVIIPAGQTSANFTIALFDDATLDGPQSATITATFPNYDIGAATVGVQDNETTTVSVTLPASISEGDTPLVNGGTVTLGTIPTSDLTLILASSDMTELAVPSSVLIAAGQTSAGFTLTPVNDTLVDGDQSATISATLAGSTPGTGTITVTDNEARTLTVTFNYSSRSEGSGTTTSGGSVSLSGTAVTPVTVTLVSSDLTELQNTTATITAGSSSGSFNITTVNDALFDGTQTVTLTASSPSFTDGTRTINITDDDVHNFLVSTIASPQVRKGPFNVTFTARDINNTTITGYSGTPTLSAADGGAVLGITPATLTGFSNGMKTQSVAVQDFGANAVLTVTDSITNGPGSSNAFVVGAGPVDHFDWAAIPSPQTTGITFTASLTAKDRYENLVAGYTGTAQLEALQGYAATTAGIGASSDWYPFCGYYPHNRCQMIYSPSEVGATPRRLRALAFDMVTPSVSYPAVTLSNFTIRLKNTSKSSYSGSAVWESTGWTTVFQGTASMDQTGWRQFDFSVPFDYDGSSHLMVDISSSQATFANRIEARYTSASSRSIYRFTSGTPDPLTWSGTSPTPVSSSQLPNLRLLSYDPVPMSPAQATSFANGGWSGNVNIMEAGSQLRVQARDGNSRGVSNAFDVFPTPALSLSLPPSATESAGTVSGTVNLSFTPVSDTTVTLASNDPTEAAPASSTVIIPAGSNTANFTLNVMDDALRDGVQNVVITATTPGVADGTAPISILDDDIHNFLISAVASPQVRNSPFTVTFTARDVNNAIIPSYNGSPVLTAAEGGTSLGVTPGIVTAFSNGVKTQSVTATDFAAAAVLTLTDPETGASGSSNPFGVATGALARFVWNPVSSPQIAGVSFPVTIIAQDAASNVVNGFTGTANLSLVPSGSSPSPAVTGAFTEGVWTGAVAIPSAGVAIQLKATNGSIEGLSNAFAVDEPSAPTPVLLSEPSFTGGTSNLIAWNIDPPGTEVAAERDTSPVFASPVTAPWTGNTSYAFGGHLDGVTYHYRVRSRMLGAAPAAEVWTQTSSSDFTLHGSHVSTDSLTQPGSVRLASSGMREDFEGAAADWSDTIFTNRTSATYTKSAAAANLPVTTPQLPISADPDQEGEILGNNVYALRPETPGNILTDCSITAQIYPRNLTALNYVGLLARATGSGPSLNGYLARVHYNASLASPVWLGVSAITNGAVSTLILAGPQISFDPSTEHFQVDLTVTGSNITARLWKVRVSGSLTVVSLVDTRSGTDSSFGSGVCGLYVNQGAVFDGVSINGTGHVASGTFTSEPFTPSNFGRWSTLSYTTLTPADTSCTIDVLHPNGTALATSVPSGTDLNTFPAVAAQPSIRLRANLTTSNPAATPELQEWTVAYIPPTPFVYSPWSNIVSSTQDATPPVISVPELTTTSAGAVLSGGAIDAVSGVASVTIAGLNATTSNSFADWNGTVASLTDGLNSVTVTAADNAVPPNTSMVTAVVYRLVTPEGDPNNNGVSSLLEHALGIPAGTANPRALLPAAITQTDGGTGERFLTLDYRRRIQRSGLQYIIETSGSLTGWNATGADVVELSVTPTGDGITEAVRIRVTPAVTVQNAKFVRLRVVIQ